MCFHQKQKAGIKYTNDKVQFTIFLPSNNNKIISKKICGQTMNQMLVKKKYARIRSNISWTNNTLYIYMKLFFSFNKNAIIWWKRKTILEYLKFKSKNCNSAKKVQSASHKSEVVREVLEPLHSTYTKEKSGEFHHAECGSALLWQLLDLDKNNTWRSGT